MLTLLPVLSFGQKFGETVIFYTEPQNRESMNAGNMLAAAIVAGDKGNSSSENMDVFVLWTSPFIYSQLRHCTDSANAQASECWSTLEEAIDWNYIDRDFVYLEPIKANTLHTHSIANVTGLQTALDSKLSAEVDGSTTNEIEISHGSTTFSGLTLTTQYTVTHGLPFTPSKVQLQPRSVNAAALFYIDNITSTTFRITFVVVPTLGTNNISFDWFAYR